MMNPMENPFAVGDAVQVIDRPECDAVVLEVRGDCVKVCSETDFGPLVWWSDGQHWERAAKLLEVEPPRAGEHVHVQRGEFDHLHLHETFSV